MRSQTVTLLIQGMYVCIPYIDTIVTTLGFRPSWSPVFMTDYALYEFLLSGALAEVSDVIINNSCDSITISWSAPFSLDVSGVDPDIWYSVLISNVTDEDHPTAVPCTDCHKLTQTHYMHCKNVRVISTLAGLSQLHLFRGFYSVHV